MGSVYFAVVCAAVVLVIFWGARNDQTPAEKQTGPFALRQGAGAGKSKAHRDTTKGR